MKRALSIYLPRWPITLAMREQRKIKPQHTQPDRAAILLVSKKGSVETVAACCGRAASDGVAIGMTLAHARSLLKEPDTRIYEFTPNADAEKLRSLARWALRFSPCVGPDYPDGLLLDITGCEQLFHGEKNHLETIAASFDTLNIPARLASAPTVGSAWAVARYGASRITFVSKVQDALSPLPVSALRLSEGTCNALDEVEITRIGQLFALPKTQLAIRFGDQLLKRIDQATGVRRERIETIQIKTWPRVSRAFDGPVQRYDIVENVVEKLLSELTRKLTPQGKGVRCLHVQLQRVRLAPENLTLTLSYPSRNKKHLWSLLQPRLERAHLGFGVEAVTLSALQSESLSHDQLEIWNGVSGADGNAAALGALLDRLIQRLGQNSVSKIEPVETHVPENAFVSAAVEVRHGKSRKVKSMHKTGINTTRRPSRLFDFPQPIKVMALVPDGPPAWMKWRGQEFRILISQGPERIACPWWDESRNKERDYYEVQTNRGQWLWVYRDSESGNWFVHGEWA
ncbi:MAG: DNA polymerase Y family protein [Phycisphaerales bacterium]|nr:DNA polymerase Y family protein [Phycisphaerales bacterium]